MIQEQKYRRPVFYGWWIALGGMVVLTLTSGIGILGHTLILDPLAAEFSWSKATISSAISLFFFISAVAGSLIGGLIDRYGPSPMLVFGALCMGTGFILLGRIQELWQLYAVYLLFGIGMSATHVVPVSTVVAKWFIRKRGLAMSLAMSGLSLGGVFLVPLGSHWLHGLGLRATLPLFGLMFWVAIIPIGLFLMKKEPGVMGLLPDGEDPVSGSPDFSYGSNGLSGQGKTWTRRQAMSTRAFWSIAIAFFLVLSGQVGFLIHEVSFLSPSLGPAGGAAAVSLTSATSFISRFLVGSFVDRVDKRVVAAICFLLQGAAIFTASCSSSPIALYLCVITAGFTIGNILMMQSLIVGEFFGLASFGRVSGMITLFMTSGSAFAPTITGILFDHTGSYFASFALFGLADVLAALVILGSRPSTRDPG
jgi:MFS family permease